MKATVGAKVHPRYIGIKELIIGGLRQLLSCLIQ